jgi:hypothetical protein
MILSSNVSSEKIFLFFSRLGKSIPDLVRLSGPRRMGFHFEDEPELHCQKQWETQDW